MTRSFMMMPAHAPDWYVVIPVKGGPRAKSRLVVEHHGARAALARAIAEDCVTAAVDGLPPRRVVVATADSEVAAWARGAGASVATDPGRGLNAAVRAGVRSVHHEVGSSTCAVAVLLGDLPALRPTDLRRALAACADDERAIVPDLAGSGTVLLTTRDSRNLTPSFGAGSAGRHEAMGHVRRDLDLPRLRTDVDDTASLAAALALGVGPKTEAVASGVIRALHGSALG